MPLSAPKVNWYNELNTVQQTEWNAGIVDAGYYSRPEDPTVPDTEAFPSTFLVWNNRYDPSGTGNGTNPTGNTTAVSDMTNVWITTLSLIRDINGNIDPNLSYQPGGTPGSAQNAVAGKEQAFVEVIFWDSSKSGGAGQWGSYGSDDATWQANTWKEIGGNDKARVVSASGAKGTIKGIANTANLTADKTNYAKIKMRLYVRPNATAGKVEWITRLSYQYQG